MVKAISEYRRRELRQLVKHADQTIFENLVQFLENDPIGYGTGYKKEMIWRYIKRYSLNEEYIQRLEEGAYKYLERPMSREFKFMCQTMSSIATDAFWKRVEVALKSDNPFMQINAYCLYTYRDGMEAGEKQRLDLNAIKWELTTSYWHGSQYYRIGSFLSLLHEAENWPDGEVIYKEPNLENIPLIYGADWALKFAVINIAMSNKDIVLKKLKTVLSAGILDPATTEGWLYAIYLLGQINHPEAVPILIEFLSQKFDYHPRSWSKELLINNVLEVLNDYATPEALEAIKRWEHLSKNNWYARIDLH